MSEISNIKQQESFQYEANSNVCVGEITDISKEGKLAVDYQGNHYEGVRCIGGLLNYDDCRQNLPISVLLIFEENDFSLPIIIGKLSDTVPVTNKVSVESKLPENVEKSLSVDGETVTLKAKKEILLKCGKSSILLKKNGKIVVKGTEIISRSSGNNKLKGATVSIN